MQFQPLRELVGCLGMKHPVQRVRKLFFATVDYWLEHMDHFLLTFPSPSSHPFVATPGTPLFGRSPVAQRIPGLYYDSVRKMFDSLLALVYGTPVFQLMTRTMSSGRARAPWRAG